MSTKNKTFFFLSALLISLAVGYANKAFIKVSNPENQTKNNFSLVHGGTIYSIDNEWYLPQVRNLLNGNGYRIDVTNDYSTVRRTPGYSLWALMHFAVFGEKIAHKVLPLSQSTIFALSALAMVLAVFNISGRKRLAKTVGWIYLLCPFVVGYTIYTITEAIHPEFCVFAFYFYSKFHKTKKLKFLVWTGVFIGVATLIRPTNGLLLVSVSLGILSIYSPFRNLGSFIKSSILLSLGFGLILSPWIIRNYIVTKGELVVLEKFYEENPMNFGRGQTHMSQWMMAWSNPSTVSYSNKLIEIARERDSTNNAVEKLVSQLPQEAFYGNSELQIKEAFIALKECYAYKIDTHSILPAHSDIREPKCEIDVARKFSNLTRNFQAHAPFYYYLWTPFVVRGKEYVFQSFSTMHPYTLSADWEPTFAKNALKAYCYLFNLMLFIFLVTSFFYHKTCKIYIVPLSFSLITLLAMLYLAHVEGRYILSIYPFLVIFAGLSVDKIYSYKVRHYLGKSTFY